MYPVDNTAIPCVLNAAICAGGGGIAGHRVLQALPREPDIKWLLQGPPEEGRSDVASIQALGWPFPDLFCSVDAVVTKPSYGTVAEATCNGARVFFLRRGDWIEEP